MSRISTSEDGEDCPGQFASPPCFMHELDPSYLGMPADPQQARDVARWRKCERERLIAARFAMSADERLEHAARIAHDLDAFVAITPELSHPLGNGYFFACGVDTAFELCENTVVAPGGTIANIGVHGKKADLLLELLLWDRNITITTRLVDTASMPMLLNILRSHRIDPKLLITHRFELDRIIDAYETFAHAADTRALKVIVEA